MENGVNEKVKENYKVKKFIFLGILSFVIIFVAALSQGMKRKGCISPGININKKYDKLINKDDVKILILGDTGMANARQIKIAQASATTCGDLGCDVAVLLGDNFYQRGVEDVKDPQFNVKFEKMYPHNIPFYAILGNHDVRENWKAQIEYSNYSKRWIMPDINYGFSAGPVAFSAINSNCRPLPFLNIKWGGSMAWKVVLSHHPYISSGNHGGMDKVSQMAFERVGADFIFSGHEHLLEHLRKEGVDQIISGGSGGTLQRKERIDSDYSKYILRDHGYVWANFTKKSAHFKFFDKDGEEVYAFDRRK